MSRFSPMLLALFTCFLVSGCQNSPPWMNPYAGYGSPRVPPPATGSFQPNTPYYPQSPAPGGSASRNLSVPTQSAALPAGSAWQPVNGASISAPTATAAIGSGVQQNNAVAQAVFNQPLSKGNATAAVGDPFQSAGVSSMVQASATSPQLQPMRVNDATGISQPTMVARGQYLEISQLRQPVRPAFPGSNPLRGLSAAQQPGALPPPSAAVAAMTPVFGSTTQTTASNNSTTTASGWRAKYTPSVATGLSP